jgi:cullin-associated NEDD8-dissociated protein 1
MSLKSKNLLPIDASNSNQPCDVFGLHPRLPLLQHLYESKEAIFLANVGLLTKPTTKFTDIGNIDVQLFAHNSSKYMFFCPSFFVPLHNFL